jgi:filamin
LTAICDNIVLKGCPIIINVKADSDKIKLDGTERYAEVNQPLEICVNPMGAGKANVQVTTTSPSGVDVVCRVEERQGKYFAKLYPTEVGNWVTTVLFDNEEVNGSPYTMSAFDPTQARIIGLDRKSTYQVNHPIEFKSKCL